MNDMIEKVKKSCLKLFNIYPDKDKTLLACELSTKNQIFTPIIEPSCCKDGSKFYFISQKNLVVYDSMNQSLKIMKNNMNIRSHSKLFNFKSNICLYGGSKCPIPMILQSDKFVPYPILNKNQNESLNYLTHVDPPTKGKMNHTCCSYNEYIIIYGGYSKDKNSPFSSKICFFNT